MTALLETGRLPGLTREEVRCIHLWCRRRATQKVQRALDMMPWWLRRTPHEEVRFQLGLTVEEYRSARRWLAQAADRCADSSDHLSIHETLLVIAEEHVGLVIRFGFLKGSHTHEQLRSMLGVSERDLDVISEWWRDGMAAVRERRPSRRAA